MTQHLSRSRRKAVLDVELVPGTTGDASTLAGAYELGKGSSSTALRDIVTLSGA